jgi:hypothetical protein
MDGITIKKSIFVIGIILLVIIWTRNLGFFPLKPKPYEETSIEQGVKQRTRQNQEQKQDEDTKRFQISKIKSSSTFVYQQDYKDPFKAPFLVERGKSDTLSTKATRAKMEEPLPPKLILIGIVWDSQRSVATVKDDLGQTFVVARGDKIGDMVIDKISQEEFYYTFRGKQYKLLISGR